MHKETGNTLVVEQAKLVADEIEGMIVGDEIEGMIVADEILGRTVLHEEPAGIRSNTKALDKFEPPPRIWVFWSSAVGKSDCCKKIK